MRRALTDMSRGSARRGAVGAGAARCVRVIRDGPRRLSTVRRAAAALPTHFTLERPPEGPLAGAGRAAAAARRLRKPAGPSSIARPDINKIHVLININLLANLQTRRRRLAYTPMYNTH